MISQTQCTSFKAELYQGVHNLLTDTLKLALYTAAADIGAATTVYTTVGEVVGTGYTAGGVVVTGATVGTSNNIAYVNFSNVVWSPAGFTSRGALLYNASKGNKAIAVLDFGSDKVTTTFMTVVMPANTATSALIRSDR
jgi:hypothetical protein